MVNVINWQLYWKSWKIKTRNPTFLLCKAIWRLSRVVTNHLFVLFFISRCSVHRTSALIRCVCGLAETYSGETASCYLTWHTDCIHFPEAYLPFSDSRFSKEICQQVWRLCFHPLSANHRKHPNLPGISSATMRHSEQKSFSHLDAYFDRLSLSLCRC